MSKSLGNFFTVRDLLDEGVPGEVIRFVMLSTHYRKPMDWTEKKRGEAEKTLNRWLDLTSGLEPTDPELFIPRSGLIAALSDDLNTHKALQYLHSSLYVDPQALLDHARWFGFLTDAKREQYAAQYSSLSAGGGSTAQLANIATQMDSMRKAALLSKDFTQLDNLKSALQEAGVEVRMSKSGIDLVAGPSFDKTKLEALS